MANVPGYHEQRLIVRTMANILDDRPTKAEVRAAYNVAVQRVRNVLQAFRDDDKRRMDARVGFWSDGKEPGLPPLTDEAIAESLMDQFDARMREIDVHSRG